MSTDVHPLSFRQQQAVSSLLEDGSPKRAATAARVNERTVRRWQSTEVFRGEYRRRARALSDDAAVGLLAASSEAVRTLRTAMVSGSPATRVRAARAVLELASKLQDDDLADRLAELERRAGQWTDGPSQLGWTG